MPKTTFGSGPIIGGRSSHLTGDYTEYVSRLEKLFADQKSDGNAHIMEEYDETIGERFYTYRNSWVKAQDILRKKNPEKYGKFRVTFNTAPRTSAGASIHIAWARISWIVDTLKKR